MFLEVLGIVFKPLVGMFQDHQKEKARKQQNKEMIETAKVQHKIKRIENGDTHAMQLDVIERQNAGLKDDISFYLFLSPVLLVFFPEMVPHVKAGFAVLEEMPDWYKITIAGMLIAVWGYRQLVMPIVQKWLEIKFK